MTEQAVIAELITWRHSDGRVVLEATPALPALGRFIGQSSFLIQPEGGRPVPVAMEFPIIGAESIAQAFELWPVAYQHWAPIRFQQWKDQQAAQVAPLIIPASQLRRNGDRHA